MLPQQLSLPLFDPPTFSELLAASGKTDALSITLNKRLRRGWRVQVERPGGKRALTAPAYFADAPLEVKQALVEWALAPDPRRSRRRQELLRRRRQLERILWEYAAEAEPRSAVAARRDPARREGGAVGCRYDLAEVLDHVNRTCFGGRLSSQVRWGSFASTTSYQAHRTGPDGRRYSLITIAGLYDHPSVPRFAIEGVMHHEMLHIALPPGTGRARRSVHSREFRQAERGFAHWERWEQWQKTEGRRIALRMRKERARRARQRARLV